MRPSKHFSVVLCELRADLKERSSLRLLSVGARIVERDSVDDALSVAAIGTPEIVQQPLAALFLLLN